MAGYRSRWAVAAALVGAVGAGVVGCGGGEDGPGAQASDAASALRSAASEATDRWASATAEADRRFDEIKGGVDVTKDVTLGATATGQDGRTTAEVRVRNTAGGAKSFAVQVNFTDPGGGLRDAVVVTVADVPAGQTGKGTARSTHSLSGEVSAQVERAVRY
ncbi:hypothetical protein [Streptomyces chromofuscus]|uniref:Lipoprotein n=1 Tax=Streptomyces chromofuscus TaxID=42881 RepID=A0A7M2T266_STRCW|nr:hypothetical protein [Streptomyces chromofuscus]QOV41995.1 hypothetical protein IPT68_19140 [Streptomyces chromofuscus]GGS86552.1 hypothetical protein GCM10010254_02910 [Streptomyces chromofuscus]